MHASLSMISHSPILNIIIINIIMMSHFGVVVLKARLHSLMGFIMSGCRHSGHDQFDMASGKLGFGQLILIKALKKGLGY
jgi:hypothetical protein